MIYPFSAVVGLADLKLALLLNAVSPSIGGVLVRGEKGTAKSTVVRSLAALLPPVRVVAGCRFSCDPGAPDPHCPDGPHEEAGPATERPARLVELPIGAGEDRVTGSLDLERALTEGVKAFEPGLLAAAHRGVLYVDEVNLLHDHLVDLLLDAAAMGISYVEREGVSVRHAARFLLVGTMNPEEGELRPQLLDRFGLAVDVRASREPAERAEVVRRRLAFEADPAAFGGAYETGDRALAERIASARALLPRVVLPDPALRQVTAVCAAFDVDGLRADLVMARTAIALAAWEGRDEVTGDDVATAARLALPHRRRRDPFGEPGLDEERLERALADTAGDTAGEGDGPNSDGPDNEGTDHDGPDDNDPDDDGPDGGGPGGDGPDGGGPGGDGPDGGGPGGLPGGEGPGDRPAHSSERPPAPAGQPYRTRLLTPPTVGRGGPAGRRGRTTGGSAGRAVGARPVSNGRAVPLHLVATLTAAAPYQRDRGRRRGGPLVLRRADLRVAVREGRESNLVLFCVDASGSMAARARMGAVKGAVLSLLLDAYQRRDKVGLVTFRGEGATVALPPTSSVELASARLERLATGGRTPIAAGLACAARLLAAERLRDPLRRALLVVVTDGRHTAGPDPAVTARRLAADGVAGVVVDCEQGPVRLGLAGRIGAALGGVALRLDELAADGLAEIVRDVRMVA
ncbi:VWA domain-containing protein [Sphaerimonospora thailandensis]|uniref:Mg-protoporphyrin IX chelatase n=1 Tax=Sphaerimonospora thailandensis TaxID=795644 RepID=A0A8J3R3U8_9ACTN|nr:VWA domain-containing protein [Sphaerimonospora thailandensis]GIH67853.1 magnesium chelatase [Sphaerimonospora thailandensis]